jgi:hypothetical protein
VPWRDWLGILLSKRFEMSEPKENTEQGDKTAFFQTALNRHGHPFQYAVIRPANELCVQKRSGWLFVFSEFPVEVQGGHTRIDFVLSQSYRGGIGPCRLLIAECKRADPALSNWLFARAPYVNRDSAPNSILTDCVKREQRILTTSVGRNSISENIYHIAFEVKGAETGDSTATGRRTIEDAATQVMRGLNGLIECFSKNPRYLANDVPVEFIPAIFTTAKYGPRKWIFRGRTSPMGRLLSLPTV